MVRDTVVFENEENQTWTARITWSVQTKILYEVELEGFDSEEEAYEYADEYDPSED